MVLRSATLTGKGVNGSRPSANVTGEHGGLRGTIVCGRVVLCDDVTSLRSSSYFDDSTFFFFLSKRAMRRSKSKARRRCATTAHDFERQMMHASRLPISKAVATSGRGFGACRTGAFSGRPMSDFPSNNTYSIGSRHDGRDASW